MGYTQYWTQKRDFTDDEWNKLCAFFKDMHKITPLFGYDGTGDPEVDSEYIIFNGDESKGENHETMSLCKYNIGGDFCKTRRKPYDTCVVAILIAANFYAPGIYNLGSDGDAEDWTEGEELFKSITGVKRKYIRS